MSGKSKISEFNKPISSMNVLVPYTPFCNIKKGQRFDCHEKNVLITGRNASGKSSLLHMIFASMAHFQKKKIHGYSLVLRPFDYFYSRANIKTEDRKRKVPISYFLGMMGIYDRIYEDRLRSERIFFEAVHNPDLLGLKGVDESEYRNFLIDSKKKRFFDESLGETERDFDLTIDLFMEFIKDYAKETGIAKEILYETFLLAENEQFSKIKKPFSDFFYLDIKGDISRLAVDAFYQVPGEEDNFFARRLNTGNFADYDKKQFEKKDGAIQKNFDGSYKRFSKSSGQGKKGILEQILTTESKKRVLLIDEPMENLDEPSQEKYSERIIRCGRQKNTQLFLTSHDRYLNQILRGQKDWMEFNLSG